MFFTHKEQGFTLLEVLVSFAVVLVLTAMFPLFIKSLMELTEPEKGIHPLELEVFVQQAKRELRNGKSFSANESVLTIVNQQNQSIIYEWYDGKMRRRVNGSGHELMLHNVKAITFKERGNGVVFEINEGQELQIELLIDNVPVR
ncbi:hypothetical protein FIU87_14105 [Bacillus sp. THAF10]|uniref:competence type IV pilus minor pilin ComGF n=1 Tax=Bacillus sp. THAF10 TaxID=2587848 RepID=UPI001267A8E9|nr:competence type IV pilus minor pilin ComGF [Bacillus sp. THAF10]QFT89792.1 hypothetical protein FIU87_14105 [Bacillus sp. THAF10]